MRFQFRLQTLLRIRHAARDERREQLAEALRIDDALRAKQEEFEALRDEARRMQHLKTGRVDVDRLLEAQRYEAIVSAEIAHVVSQRNNVAEEVRKRRDALVEADRECKVVEKLREKRHSEYLAELQAADMKVLDEAAGRTRGEEAGV
jgi:flagellar FliJ protein